LAIVLSGILITSLVIVLSGILITSLVSFSHCIVWHSDYFFGIFWRPKDSKEVIRMSDNTMTKRYQRSNQNARQYNGQKIPKVIVFSGILITSLISFDHCMVWHSDYFFGIFWPLYCLAVWLLLWYLLAIVLSDILITSLVSFGRYQRSNQRSNQNSRQYNGQKIPKK
jgi:hypothetical protein